MALVSKSQEFHVLELDPLRAFLIGEILLIFRLVPKIHGRMSQNMAFHLTG